MDTRSRYDSFYALCYGEEPRDRNLDQRLKTGLAEKKDKSKTYQNMLNFRKKLPSYAMKEELVKTIEENQVVVISGETGCGKTTQIVQFVMDDFIERGCGSQCTIVCTQPRRISAIAVAERVAAERDEKIGENVGYHVRLEKILPKRKKGSILFCATGVMLRWMESNPVLRGITHLFLDEIHERNILSDFAITLLKHRINEKRPNLKVILMSATLNSQHFSNYFGSVPCIEIPGFTFPVEDIYLDRILSLTNFSYGYNQRYRLSLEELLKKNRDVFLNNVVPYIRDLERPRRGDILPTVASELLKPLSEILSIDLIEALIHYISLKEAEGAILVFLPGLADINNLHKQLMSREYFNNENFVILPLHSKLPTEHQKIIFNRPPKGVRKIILSTSIAETSITIDDVVYVVDSGYIKMQYLNMKLNVSTLEAEFVSGANAKQRRGRAGRVQAGKCFKLYTKAREESFDPFPLPEMQRTRLEEVILQAKVLGLGLVAPFLDKVMDPPDSKAVDLALKMLRTLNALDEEEELTPLGQHLAKLPMDPQIGKMILMAAVFGCVNPILSLAAMLSYKDPFYVPLGKEDEAKDVKLKLAKGQVSDHLVLIAAFLGWDNNRNRRKFVQEHFLSSNILHLLRNHKGDLAKHLHDMEFLRSPNPKDRNGNVNSKNIELVKAVICSGLYPNVAVVFDYVIKSKKCPPKALLRTRDHPCAQLHPRSLCSTMQGFKSPFFVYHQIMKSTSIYIHDATMVSTFPLLFFGEKLDVVESFFASMVRMGEVKVHCSKKTANSIQLLRNELDKILSRSVSDPEVVDWLTDYDRRKMVLQAIVQLVTAEKKEPDNEEEAEEEEENVNFQGESEEDI